MMVRNKFAFWTTKTWFPTERILKLILDSLYPHKIKIQESLHFSLIAKIYLSEKHHFRVGNPTKLKARGAAPGLQSSSLQLSISSSPLPHLSSFSNGTEKLKHPFYATFWLSTLSSRFYKAQSSCNISKALRKASQNEPSRIWCEMDQCPWDPLPTEHIASIRLFSFCRTDAMHCHFTQEQQRESSPLIIKETKLLNAVTVQRRKHPPPYLKDAWGNPPHYTICREQLLKWSWKSSKQDEKWQPSNKSSEKWNKGPVTWNTTQKKWNLYFKSSIPRSHLRTVFQCFGVLHPAL